MAVHERQPPFERPDDVLLGRAVRGDAEQRVQAALRRPGAEEAGHEPLLSAASVHHPPPPPSPVASVWPGSGVGRTPDS